jgi:hypothetical protein
MYRVIYRNIQVSGGQIALYNIIKSPNIEMDFTETDVMAWISFVEISKDVVGSEFSEHRN